MVNNHIHDNNGPCCSLEDHLARLADERPKVIGRLLAVVVERLGLRGMIDDEDLRDCGVLEKDEWTGEYVS